MRRRTEYISQYMSTADADAVRLAFEAVTDGAVPVRLRPRALGHTAELPLEFLAALPAVAAQLRAWGYGPRS